MISSGIYFRDAGMRRIRQTDTTSGGVSVLLVFWNGFSCFGYISILEKLNSKEETVVGEVEARV